MAKDFSKYANISVDEIETPKCPPIGHYFATIKKAELAERDFGAEHGKRVLASLVFTLTGQDEDAAAEGAMSDKELRAAIVSKDYSITGDRPQTHMVRDLASKTLGLSVTGMTFGELLEALVGQEVKLQLDQRADKNNPEVFYPEVKKVLNPAA